MSSSTTTKSLLPLLFLFLFLSSTSATFTYNETDMFNPGNMTDMQIVKFVSGLFNSLWSGYVRGFYSRSPVKYQVDKECGNEWFVQGILQLDNFTAQLIEDPMSLSLDTAH